MGPLCTLGVGLPALLLCGLLPASVALAAGDAPSAGSLARPPAPTLTLLLNEIREQSAGVDPELLEPLAEFLERPTGLDAVRSSERFSVHYATQGASAPLGWPATGFIDELLHICEHTWRTSHLELPWPVPPSDEPAGGDGRVDVYVRDLGSRGFGYSLSEERAGESQRCGFIVIDNDFVDAGGLDPWDALRVTLAHEYQHLIQFGFGYDPDAGWFMEQCATMMEGRVYPEILDHQRYLSLLTAHPYRRLDLQNDAFEYGAWLWPQYLGERGGDSMLVAIWSHWRDSGEPLWQALDRVLAPLGGLDAAYFDWTIWNAFLGPWDDGAHYADGAMYDASLLPERRIDVYPADQIRPAPLHRPAPLGASYIELRPQAASADNLLRLSLESDIEVGAAALIVWWQDGRSPEVIRPPLLSGRWVCDLPEWERVDRALLRIANGSASSGSRDYQLSAVTRYDPAAVGEESLPVSSRLQLRSHPNPFERHTILTFRLTQREPVSLRVLDASGRLVDTLVSGVRSAGDHAIRWGGLESPGACGSGVFFCEMRTGEASERIRLLRVR